jgi:phosphatidylinositol N-acetylglucosaminyltransferase subunit Q
VRLAYWFPVPGLQSVLSFFNSVWLILNDIIMGVAIGSFLRENHLLISDILFEIFEVLFFGFLHLPSADYVQIRLILGVKYVLHWLDSWPEGLKLNTELSWFYSHSFAGVVATWGGEYPVASH